MRRHARGRNRPPKVRCWAGRADLMRRCEAARSRMGRGWRGVLCLVRAWGKAEMTADSLARGTPMDSRKDTLRRSLPAMLVEISCGHAHRTLASETGTAGRGPQPMPLPRSRLASHLATACCAAAQEGVRAVVPVATRTQVPAPPTGASRGTRLRPSPPPFGGPRRDGGPAKGRGERRLGEVGERWENRIRQARLLPPPLSS